MYYVLYIDVLFLQNLLLDYLLLTVTARLLKLSPGRIRRLLAAGLGSLLLCLVYALWPRCPLPVFLLLHGALAIIMSIAGLRIAVRSRTLLGRAVILLYLCSFLLGGIFGWIQGMIRFPVYPFLGLSLLSCWLLSLAARWLFRFRQSEQQICSVTLGFHGRILRLRGLRDIEKKPSTSELVDWLRALVAGGVDPQRITEKIPYAGVLLKKDKDLRTLARNQR